jgi:3-hydroxymyristoyl/3-hydroxydecanoyl-(acyl carrier protein) dehydratase
VTIRDSITAARISGPRQVGDGSVAFEFCFSLDDPVFQGHFPGHPILPGLFQLEIARMAAEWTLQCPLALHQISKAKFQRPIRPAETIVAKLKCSELDEKIRAKVEFTVTGQRAGETTVLLWRKK